jgi:serine phosphatase RsbU (regulator of sigma subunit)
MEALEWSMACLALTGETELGDAYLVTSTPIGFLIAVIDGLGHGAKAAAAARIAVATVNANAHEPLIPLLKRCHAVLLQTRGVAMSLASFNLSEEVLTWLGVGNVEGILVRGNASANPARESLIHRGGVVGYKLPSLHVSVLSVAPGDLLIFTTDGIRSGFAEGLSVNDPTQAMADRILARDSRGTDDALVLVARYRGNKT